MGRFEYRNGSVYDVETGKAIRRDDKKCGLFPLVMCFAHFPKGHVDPFIIRIYQTPKEFIWAKGWKL